MRVCNFMEYCYLVRKIIQKMYLCFLRLILQSIPLDTSSVNKILQESKLGVQSEIKLPIFERYSCTRVVFYILLIEDKNVMKKKDNKIVGI